MHNQVTEHKINPATDRCVMCGRNRFNRTNTPICDYTAPVTQTPTNQVTDERIAEVIAYCERATKWAGVDDDLQEKDKGSGAIYDAESGEWLFRVPAQYRVLIVNAVNDLPDFAVALKEARERIAELESEKQPRIWSDNETTEAPRFRITTLSALV